VAGEGVIKSVHSPAETDADWHYCCAKALKQVRYGGKSNGVNPTGARWYSVGQEREKKENDAPEKPV